MLLSPPEATWLTAATPKGTWCTEEQREGGGLGGSSRLEVTGRACMPGCRQGPREAPPQLTEVQVCHTGSRAYPTGGRAHSSSTAQPQLTTRTAETCPLLSICLCSRTEQRTAPSCPRLAETQSLPDTQPGNAVADICGVLA